MYFFFLFTSLSISIRYCIANDFFPLIRKDQSREQCVFHTRVFFDETIKTDKIDTGTKVVIYNKS